MKTIETHRAPANFGYWFVILVGILTVLFSSSSMAQPVKTIDPDKARVVEHWTPERIAAAIPRDLAIDSRGLGYMKFPDGRLEPYGHSVAAQAGAHQDVPTPFVKPGGTTDSTPPSITGMTPGNGAIIGDSQKFSALVTDPSGVSSVSFKVWPDNGVAQSFRATHTTGDEWAITLTGFSTGPWNWQVTAKDGAAKGGNTGSSSVVNFIVDTGSGGDTGDTVTNAEWSAGGVVQNAAGRIYFEMPGNKRRTSWVGYVCSGTVAEEGISGRSVIITAAHCVYDDANKAFARNVMFIPNQAGSTAKTDLDCSNDPLGCWVPSVGVVDINWTTRTFPDNIAWDYAYYVVSDTDAHLGATASSDALDTAAGSMVVNFTTISVNDGTAGATSPDFTHALGYSYNADPNFMYCAEDMTITGSVNWWLPNCGLSGGASGGPWVQKMDLKTGNGPIVSVNSWGYTTSPGMAGPKLVDTSAECVFLGAKSESLTPVSSLDGEAGYIETCL